MSDYVIVPSEIVDKDSYIHECHKLIAEKDNHIGELTKMVAERDAKIDELILETLPKMKDVLERLINSAYAHECADKTWHRVVVKEPILEEIRKFLGK